MAKSKKSTKLSATNLVPAWSVGAYLYADYFGSPNDTSFDQANWLSSMQSLISEYNQNAAVGSQINMVYPYASDLEMPWCLNATASDYNTLSNYGFYLTPMSNLVTDSISYTGVTNSQISVIIDGRINNGSLIDFNNGSLFTTQNVQALAGLVLKGGTLAYNTTQGISHFAPNTGYLPTINGIQFDIEPFDSSQTNQITFYTEIGKALADNNQYFSIFSFPNNINENTAQMLGNNGYIIIPLYDLVDMTITPEGCTNFAASPIPSACITSASTLPMDAVSLNMDGNELNYIYSTSVPHSIAGYQNAANLTVLQTIALAQQFGVRYKFALPASASAHEFETWSILPFTFPPLTKPNKNKPTSANAIPGNSTQLTSANSTTQLGYVTAAIEAIISGIKATTNFNSDLFVGVDIYGFNPKSLWTPYPLIADFKNGNVYAGGLRENSVLVYDTNDDGWNDHAYGVSYLELTPAYPQNTVLSYIAENLRAIYELKNS